MSYIYIYIYDISSLRVNIRWRMDKIIATAGSHCLVCTMSAVQFEEANSFISCKVSALVSYHKFNVLLTVHRDISV